MMGTFIANASNLVLLGPPGTGKTHLATGLGIKAAQTGYSVAFDTATGWITRLGRAHDSDQLASELSPIGRYKQIIIDALCYTLIVRTYSSNSSTHAMRPVPSW
jgi:DNA replication protein DnaC